MLSFTARVFGCHAREPFKCVSLNFNSRGGNLGRSLSILLYFISNFIPDEGKFGILNGFQWVPSYLQTSISCKKLP